MWCHLGGTRSNDPFWNCFLQASPWEEISQSQEMRTISMKLTVASCGKGKLHAVCDALRQRRPPKQGPCSNQRNL